MEIHDLLEFLDKRIDERTKYLKHYIGKVFLIYDETDVLQKGWIKVAIPELGWFDPIMFPMDEGKDFSVWVKPRFTNSLYTPNVGDYVDVGFISGDENRPVYYGQCQEMLDQLPKAYDGVITTQVIYNNRMNTCAIIHDEKLNLLKLGMLATKGAARIGDAVVSTIADDAIFWTWLSAAAIVLAGLGVVAPTPTSLTSKITSGSNQVKIGD